MTRAYAFKRYLANKAPSPSQSVDPAINWGVGNPMSTAKHKDEGAGSNIEGFELGHIQPMPEPWTSLFKF